MITHSLNIKYQPKKHTKYSHTPHVNFCNIFFKVTIDKSSTNAFALATLNADKPAEESITVRQSKYLNNLIEQDHRNIKRRIRPMLRVKSFRRAQTLLAGIELLHMIRKGQYQHLQGDGLSPAEQFYLLVG